MSNRNPRYIYLPIAFSLVLIVGIWLGSILNRGGHSAEQSFFPLKSGSYHKVDDVFDYLICGKPILRAWRCGVFGI